MIRDFTILLATCLCLLLAPWASAQGSRLTYQGSLEDQGQPAQGNHDFRFTLFDDQDNAVGPLVELDGVSVIGGVFSVELDFGSTAFDGGERELEIGVRRPGDVGFTTLSPRSRVTSAPYAQLANTALIAEGLQTSGLAANVRIGSTRVARFESPSLGDARVILGSPLNLAEGVGATVGGGGNGTGPNQASSSFATVAGGLDNRATGYASVVSGGGRNLSSGSNSIVGGGDSNSASAPLSVVSGGGSNLASGVMAVVSGGRNNVASGQDSVVSGGGLNEALGVFSVVSGGDFNCAGGNASWAGGQSARVRPASDPGGTGPCSDLGAYPGGEGDRGTFVWAGSTSGGLGPFVSTGSNQFLVRAIGGMGVGTNAPAAQLHVRSNSATAAILERTAGDVSLSFRENGSARGVITAFSGGTFMLRSEGGIQLRTGGNVTRFQLTENGGVSIRRGPGGPDADKAIQVGTNSSTGNGAHLTNTGVWTNASSRSFKHAFESLDSMAVLDKLVSLPVMRWSYRGNDDVRHLGPTAEDFHAAFGLGSDKRYIGSVDADGVALAAIQGLNARLEAQNKAQQDELAAVRAELAALRALVLESHSKSNP